ncbi:MAG: hypothetical protein ACM3WV_12080 [Bacillota bacterium]
MRKYVNLGIFILSVALICPGALPAGSSASGTWVFDAGKDPLKADSMVDLSFLNEDEAGQSGFVGLSPDGNDFVLGNGDPVRFWGINTTVYHASDEELAAHAKFLAKMGVNMVRMHGSFNPKGEGTRVTDVDEKELDRAWRLVAAMKKEGIYVTLSPYWAHSGHLGGAVPESWGIDGYAGKDTDLWGILFFNEKLQEGYKAWMRALYTRTNPYTGLPLARDPAVGIIQVQNEDSLLFWTVDNIKPAQKALLGKKFGAWTLTKYGSFEKALASWGNIAYEDDLEKGILGLLPLHYYTLNRPGKFGPRLADQLQFYTETQHYFYAMIHDFYRNELGCKQLINATNWRTADTVKLNDAERWSYTASEVIAINNYYNGGFHKGPYEGWRIDPGDFYTDVSATLDPRQLPANVKQVKRRPHILTETSWVPPLGYQSEGPFLMAAYQSLSGVDITYWFSTGTPAYETRPYFSDINLDGDQHPMMKWIVATPGIMANFPAAALMFRKGYLKRGEPVVEEERNLEQLWQRKTPLIAEDPSYDPNRDLKIPAESNIKTPVNPLAFLVGPVLVNYGGDPSRSRVAVDLDSFIDMQNKIVRSITGELTWNFGIGICTVDAPKAQGAAGFLNKKKEINLGDLTVKIRNNYASLLLVSLDDQPIAASRKLLLQTGTIARPSGWKSEDAEMTVDGKKWRGYKVVNTGRLPWRMENILAHVAVKNTGIRSAVLLDESGRPVRKVKIKRTAQGFSLTLPKNTLYMIFQ